MASKMQWALQYAAKLGLAVIPLHTIEKGKCSCGHADCASNGKHPRTKNGLKDATRDESAIRSWWYMWPNANIGVTTGKENGIVVIDVDVDKDGDDSMTLLADQLGELPETWQQLTGGGGVHYIFKYPGKYIPSRASQLAPGVDVRGDGGYIVVAPSNHRSGRNYEWEVEHIPNDIPLAELPEMWINAMQAVSGGRGSTTEPLPEKVSQGKRNDILFRMAASLRAKGLNQLSIEAALLQENNLRCVPPLDDKEVLTIAASASKYERGAIAMPEPERARNTLENVLCDPTPDSIFAPETVGALATLKETDAAEYARLKSRLPKTISKRDLETAVSQLQMKARKMRLVEQGESDQRRAQGIITDFPDKDILIPPGWVWNEQGVRITEQRGEQTQTLVACSVPISLKTRLRNIETGEEKVGLTYRRDNHWRDLICKRSMLFSARSIVELADSGLPVSTETARCLVRFMDAQERENLEILPISDTVAHFGWIGKNRFLPGCAEGLALDFDDMSGNAAIATGYEQKGTLEEWIKQVGEVVRKQHPVARCQMAAGFASPLLHLLGERVFIVYVWGPSGGGKTAGSVAAISVWGDPETLKTSFNTTRVGLEHMAGLYHDLPLLIDERQVAGEGDKADALVQSLVYMLGTGKGKTRGRRGGGLQKVETWRTITLATGEQPLSSNSAMGGVKNRLIEVYARPFEGRDEDARRMYSVTEEQHGTAGVAFIRKLMDADIGSIRKIRDEFADSFTKSMPQLQPPHIRAMALLCTADYLQSVWLHEMDEAAALAEAYSMGVSVLGLLETKDEINDANRAMEHFESWLGVNRGMFKENAPSGKRYGFIEEYEIHIYPGVFDAAMREGGFNPTRVLRDWAEREWIDTEDAGGKKRYSLRRRHGNIGRERFIVVNREGKFPLPFDDDI